MKRKIYDLYIGLFFTVLIVILFFLANGVVGILWMVLVCLQCIIVSMLWFKKSYTAKTIAFLMMPVILFSCFLPRSAKNNIHKIEKEHTKNLSIL